MKKIVTIVLFFLSLFAIFMWISNSFEEEMWQEVLQENLKNWTYNINRGVSKIINWDFEVKWDVNIDWNIYIYWDLKIIWNLKVNWKLKIIWKFEVKWNIENNWRIYIYSNELKKFEWKFWNNIEINELFDEIDPMLKIDLSSQDLDLIKNNFINQTKYTHVELAKKLKEKYVYSNNTKEITEIKQNILNLRDSLYNFELMFFIENDDLLIYKKFVETKLYKTQKLIEKYKKKDLTIIQKHLSKEKLKLILEKIDKFSYSKKQNFMYNFLIKINELVQKTDNINKLNILSALNATIQYKIQWYSNEKIENLIFDPLEDKINVYVDVQDKDTKNYYFIEAKDDIPGLITKNQFDMIISWSLIFWNNDAKYTIVEFSDLECILCKSHYINWTIEKFQQQNWHNFNYIFKNFPLSFHENAYNTALSLECVWKFEWIEKYNLYKNEILSDKLNQPTKENLNKILQNLWLNVEKINKCVDDLETKEIVENDLRVWKEIFWISWTPHTVIINNKTLKYIIFKWAYPLSIFNKRFELIK